MKTTKLLYMGVALLLSGCSTENALEEGGRVPVRLDYSVVQTEQTRAAQNLNESHFAESDKIKVGISNTGEGTYTYYDYVVTDASTGALAPASLPMAYYPINGTNIDIIAYYPITAGTTFSVKSDQIPDEAYKASDLMYANTDGTNPLTNLEMTAIARTLKFEHKMAKIIVSATPGTGVTSITGVKLKDIQPTVTFTPATGAISGLTGSTDILMSNNGAALIPAQTVNGTFLEIITDAGTATYSLSSKEFVAGHAYTINLTVNSTAIGTTNTITGWSDSNSTVVVSAYNSYEPANATAVDIGLSVKWANMNVGATTATDYGAYFAWGETKGYITGGVNVKTVYASNWSDYWWGNSTASLKKYVCSASNGTVDNRSTLLPEDDAARTNWGGSWRMPTESEIQELYNTKNDGNYVWNWETNYQGVSGCNGYLITSNKTGTVGNFIFLPAAGYRMDSQIYNPGDIGCYWSSSILTSANQSFYATDLNYSKNNNYIRLNGNSRMYGYSVRAVQDK